MYTHIFMCMSLYVYLYIFLYIQHARRAMELPSANQPTICTKQNQPPNARVQLFKSQLNSYVTLKSQLATQCTTGWRRPIGCLKLQVIFRNRATNHRAILRKTTCKAKASYDSTPPCTHNLWKRPLRNSIHLRNSLYCESQYFEGGLEFLKSQFATEWHRVIGCLILIGHFPQKSPIISGSFADNDPQLKASYGSSPPCTINVLYHYSADSWK